MGFGKINIIGVMVVVLAAQGATATEFLFNWQSSTDSGIYDGFIEENVTAIGNSFGRPSGVEAFSFGSPVGTYTAANSVLNTSIGGVDFEIQGGVLAPIGNFGFQVLTPDRSQELLVFSELQAQETDPGQAGVINGNWTATNLDTMIPDTTDSALLLAMALGALGVFHALGRRRLALHGIMKGDLTE